MSYMHLNLKLSELDWSVMGLTCDKVLMAKESLICYPTQETENTDLKPEFLSRSLTESPYGSVLILKSPGHPTLHKS